MSNRLSTAPASLFSNNKRLDPRVAQALQGNSALWDWDRRWFRIGETPFVDLTLCINTPSFGCDVSMPIDSETLVTGRYPDGFPLCGEPFASDSRATGVLGTNWAGEIPRRCPNWFEGTFIGPTSNFGYWEVPCDDFGFLRYGIQIERSILAQRLLRTLQAEQDSYTDAASALSWANRTVAALKVFWHSTNVAWRPAFISRMVRDGLLVKSVAGTPSITNSRGSRGDVQTDTIYLYMPEAYRDRVGSVEGHYKDAFRGNAPLDPQRDVFPRNVPPIPWGQADFQWGTGDRYRRAMNRPSQKDQDVLPQTLNAGERLGYFPSSIWNWRQDGTVGMGTPSNTQVLPENFLVVSEIATREAWAESTYGRGNEVSFPNGLYIGWNHKKEFFADEWEWRERKGNVIVSGFDSYLRYLKGEIAAALRSNVLGWVTQSIEVYSDEVQTTFAASPENSLGLSNPRDQRAIDIQESRRKVTEFSARVAAARASEVTGGITTATALLTTVVTLANAGIGAIVGLVAVAINVIAGFIADGVGQTGNAPYVAPLPFERMIATTADCPEQDTATFIAQLEGAFNAVQNGPPPGPQVPSGGMQKGRTSYTGPVVTVASVLFLLSLFRGR